MGASPEAFSGRGGGWLHAAVCVHGLLNDGLCEVKEQHRAWYAEGAPSVLGEVILLSDQHQELVQNPYYVLDTVLHAFRALSH